MTVAVDDVMDGTVGQQEGREGDGEAHGDTKQGAAEPGCSVWLCAATTPAATSSSAARIVAWPIRSVRPNG